METTIDFRLALGRALLPLPRQLVAAPRELLLRLEQFEPRRNPLFTCPASCASSSFFTPSAFAPRSIHVSSHVPAVIPAVDAGSTS